MSALARAVFERATPAPTTPPATRDATHSPSPAPSPSPSPPPSTSPTATTTPAPAPSAARRLATALDPALVLENAGSVARDHLASERTFLAYTRTSLVIASTGVALVQLFTISATTSPSAPDAPAPTPSFAPTSPRLARYARPLGAATIAFGIFVLAVGLTRYFTIQRALISGSFPAARLLVLLIATGLAVLIAVVFGVLVGEG
ncbi:hypothetical protein HDZ31DRAFT_64250 [Schizophyllum fasciatum]